MFIATWIIGAKEKKWKQSEYPSIVKYLDKWCCIQALDYYAVIRNSQLVVTTFDLKDIHVFLSIKKQKL